MAGRASAARAFGQPLTGYADGRAAVATVLARAAEKRRAPGDMAHVLTGYLRQNRFAAPVRPPSSRSATVTVPGAPTADPAVLLRYANALRGRLWKAGAAYYKAGVVLDGLEPPGTGPPLTLFGPSPTPAQQTNERKEKPPPTRRPGLLARLDALNQRWPWLKVWYKG